MQLLLIIAGIVGVVLDQYFAHQHTLGWALIALGVALILVQLIMVKLTVNKIKRGFNPARNRRGF